MQTLHQQRLFFGIVLISAISFGAIKVQDGNYYEWGVHISLEALRAAVLFSNVLVMTTSKENAKRVLWISIAVTVILAVSTHFYVVESVEGMTGTEAFQTQKWWTLQGLNWLILGAEWTFSILAGSTDWKGMYENLKGNFDSVSSTRDMLLERVKKAQDFEDENQALKDQVMELETERDGLIKKLTVSQQGLNGKAKYVDVGKVCTDVAIVTDTPNKYVLYCSGTKAKPGIHTLTFGKNQTEIVCETCGRVHDTKKRPAFPK